MLPLVGEKDDGGGWANAASQHRAFVLRIEPLRVSPPNGASIDFRKEEPPMARLITEHDLYYLRSCLTHLRTRAAFASRPCGRHPYRGGAL